MIRRHSNRGSSNRHGVALAAVLLIGMGIMIVALGVIHLVRADVASLGAAAYAPGQRPSRKTVTQ